ncbi:structural maintenance of chromosomes protein 6-like [Paramacrobiotus metropolitanus]|uniref:structural maintenance of chromosomes protein 6-like n=1 Tax=Paramacrobiotus metropolitanus TaxID=2943436 RepID=UPI002445A1E0|nr:structural maintenance of chromosomes protein 6-like [Paramacrobiotus metropolitanus]
MENDCPNVKRKAGTKPRIPEAEMDCIDEHQRVQKRLKASHLDEEKLVWNGKTWDLPVRLAGGIMRVEIENFVCFDKRDLDLHPYVNFISGTNGSGKSTLAKAIAIALGSQLTPRKSHMKMEHYIKADSSSATIRLHINNQGTNRYRPNEFGDSLLLTRTISKRGLDGYLLSRLDGSRPVKGRAKFLEAVKCLGIQIDNPVFFMDQEDSKTFLTKYKPDKLYEFYYNGSGLAYAEQLTIEAEINERKKRKEIAMKKQELRESEKSLTEWRKKYELTRVNGEDNDFEATKRKLDILKARQLMQEIQKLEKEVEIIYVDLKKSQEALRIQESLSTPVSSAKKTASRNAKSNHKLEKMRHDLELVRTKWKNEIHRKTEEIQQLQAQIVDKSALLQKRNRSLRSNSRRRTVGSSAQANELQQELDEALQRQSELTATIEKEKALEDDIINCRRIVESLENESRLLESGETDTGKLCLDDYCARVVVSEESPQVKHITGPMGKFVSLRNAQCRQAVDQTVGNFLHGYILDLSVKIGDYSGQLITEIGKACRSSKIPVAPLILAGKQRSNRASETSIPVGSSKGFLVKEALDIKSERVAEALDNILSRSVGMDRCEEALKLLLDLKIEDNVERVVDSKGNSYESCEDYVIISAPEDAVFQTPSHFEHDSSRDMGEQIEEARASLARAQRAFNRARTKHKNITIEDLEQQKDETARTIQNLTRLLNTSRTGDSVADSSMCSEDDSELVQASLAEDTEKLESIKAEKRLLEIKKKMEIAELAQKVKSAEAEQSLIMVEEDFIEHEVTPVKSARKGRKRKQVIELEQRVQMLSKQRKDKLSQIQEKKMEYEAQKRAFVVLNVDIESVIPTESYDVLKQRLDRIKAKEIAQSVVGNSSLETCQEKVEAYEITCQTAREQLALAESVVTEAENKTEQQKKNEEIVRSRFQDRAELTCVAILNDGGFDGNLQFDPARKELHYLVKPKTANRFGSLETLSGGEKAFAMVAFLVSFWESNHPFRILDEFDCYMDMQNRESALNLLLKRAFRDRIQSVFLSPLEIDYEKILKLAGPENRNNIKRINLSTE